MKKYRISNCGSKLDWLKYFQVNYNAELIPMLNKEFLDDNIETALKQAFCIIMDYLKTSSLSISQIDIENGTGSDYKVKYIIFRSWEGIQGFFKLEEVSQ